MRRARVWQMLVLMGVLAAAAPVASRGDEKAPPADDAKALIGTWRLVEHLGPSTLRAVVVFVERDGRVEGSYQCMGRTTPLAEIVVEKERVSFRRQVGDESFEFTGTLEADRLRGTTRTPFGELRCTAHRPRKRHVF